MNRQQSAVCIGDETVIDVKPEDFYGRDFVEKILSRKPYSYTWEGVYADVLVEFDQKPEIVPGGTVSGRITLINHTLPEQKHYRARFLAPEGWQVSYKKNLFTPSLGSQHRDYDGTPFTIQAGEDVQAVNSLILEITCAGRPMPILVPMQIMG